MEIIEVKNLSFSYNDFSEKVLDDINFSIRQGSFNIICGKSGCGKSTLLKCIKHIIAPAGTRTGSVVYNGKDVSQTDERTLVTDIGYVSQSPDSQTVTAKVSDELAFGLENIGTDRDQILRTIAETAYYFGISEWYPKDISTLSGGQKQLLNLAAVIAMRPRVLLLDEPTSQLDPITRESFINTVKRLNKDMAMTVIICEHDLEDIFEDADKIILLDSGQVICEQSPHITAEYIMHHNHSMKHSLPVCTQLCHAVSPDSGCILSKVRTMEIIEKFKGCNSKNNHQTAIRRDKAFEIKGAFFRYNKNSEDIINDLSLTGYRGEILALSGANACGKTTLLSVISGDRKIYRGKVRLKNERVVLMPQNPRSLFIKESVIEDIRFEAALNNKSNDDIDRLIGSSEFFKDIKLIYKKNPLDLSGGEMQRLAFFKLMLTDPTIIVLDEPTKGLDNSSKNDLLAVLIQLRSRNICIVMATHDLEFAASCADRCAMIFNGSIISCEEPHLFFSTNYYYTTRINKLVKRKFPCAITLSEVEQLCRNKID